MATSFFTNKMFLNKMGNLMETKTIGKGVRGLGLISKDGIKSLV